MKANCSKCSFWVIDEPHFTYGMCHRYPPKPDFSVSMKPARYGDGGEISINRRAAPIYPNTHEKDWCGEFSLRDNT
jgi:hypothetical protein